VVAVSYLKIDLSWSFFQFFGLFIYFYSQYATCENIF
jgi:hypothetical protein